MTSMRTTLQTVPECLPADDFTKSTGQNAHGVVVRCVCIPRCRLQNDFGFTLRHFIVYPPDVYIPNEGSNSCETDTQPRLGQVTEPVDTIFVKSIRENGPAARAQLCVGDRVVSVNGEPIVGKSYDQVVLMIQTSPATLSLEVTPKQYDTLQLFYEEKAYRPETNQRPPVLSSNSANVIFSGKWKNHVVSIPVQQINCNNNDINRVPISNPEILYLNHCIDKYEQERNNEGLLQKSQQNHNLINNYLNKNYNNQRNNINHNFYHHYHQQQQPLQHQIGVGEGSGGVGELLLLPFSSSSVPISGNSSYESVFLPDSHPSTLICRGNMSSSNSPFPLQGVPSLTTVLSSAAQIPQSEVIPPSVSTSLKPSQHAPPQLLSHLPRPTPYKSTVLWSHLNSSQQQQKQFQQQQNVPTKYSGKALHPQTYYPFNQRSVGIRIGASADIVPTGSSGAGTKSHESILAVSATESEGERNRYGSMECLSTGASPGVGAGVSRYHQGESGGQSSWKNIVGYRYSISTGPDIDYRRESTISLPPAHSYSNVCATSAPAVTNTIVFPANSAADGQGTSSMICSAGDLSGGIHKSQRDPGSFSMDCGDADANNSHGYEVKMVDRIRRSCEQKEEFLRRPNQPMVWAPLTPNSAAAAGFPKELYAQPQKFQKVPWPPASIQQQNSVGGNIQQTSSPTPASLAVEETSSAMTPNNNINANSAGGIIGLRALTTSDTTFLDTLSGSGYPSRKGVDASARAGEYSLLDYGSAKNRLTVVGSGKLHCDPPPDWKPSPAVIISTSSTVDPDPSQVFNSVNERTHPESNVCTTSNDETELFLQNRSDTDVILRKRDNDAEHEHDRLVRRVSYLKATSSPIDMERHNSSPTTPTKRISYDADEIVLLPLPPSTTCSSTTPLRKSTTDPGTSPGRRRSMANKLGSDFLHKGRIVRLKQFFEERTQPSSLFKFHSYSPTTEFRHFGSFRSEKSPDDTEIVRDGPVHFKVRAGESKKVGYYRSWRQGWAQLRRSGCLYLSKERISKDSISGGEDNVAILCVGIKEGVAVEPAEDYTKRKNVIRLRTYSGPSNSTGSGPVPGMGSQANVTLLAPSLASVEIHHSNPSLLSQFEILIQAEDPSELSQWLKAFQLQHDNNNYCNSANRGDSVPCSSTGLVSEKSSKLKSIPGGFNSVASSTPSFSSNTISNNHLSVSQHHLSQNPTSPKSKTWKAKVAKQLQKMHIPSGSLGGSSHTAIYNPQGMIIPEIGATFGVPLEECPLGMNNPAIPRAMEICINTIETRGLGMVGIYRIPGNNAAVGALTESLNKGNQPNPEQDPRWNDVHVISSMLKSFLRNLPDPLLTSEKYEEFIRAVSSDSDDTVQFARIKNLIDSLPELNYETLQCLILHLRKVSENSEKNRMESKNISIVFGPTLVRPGENSAAIMVQHMSYQCKLVELLINNAYDFFPPRRCSEVAPGTETSATETSFTASITSTLAISDAVAKNDIRASLIQAAQRKVSRQQMQPTHYTYGLPASPVQSKPNAVDESGLIRSYTGLGAETEQRVRQFEMETRAYLTRDGRSPNSGLQLSTPSPTGIAMRSIPPKPSIVGILAPSASVNPSEEERRLEKLRLEAEWRKAKDDLENEDFYDRLADNPSTIVHHRDHGLPPYSLLSHNVSSSSVSSSNSAGGATTDATETGTAISPTNPCTWPLKLGPTPFKVHTPSPQSSHLLQQQHSLPTPTPSLPPKPPFFNVSASPATYNKLTKTLNVVSSHQNSPLRKVNSVEHLPMPKVRQQGYFITSGSEGFDASKVTGRETLRRKKPPESQTMAPYDPKLCGSLDSLRDIVNGGSREDVSLRSSNGSDLVVAMSREYEQKLSALRPKVKHRNTMTWAGGGPTNDDDGLDNAARIDKRDELPRQESIILCTGNTQSGASVSEDCRLVPDGVIAMQGIKKTIVGDSFRTSNGVVTPLINKGRSKSMIDRRRPCIDETNDKNSENVIYSYRDPSLHRVANNSGNDDGSWVSCAPGEEAEEASLSTESQHGLLPHQYHHRQSSASLTKEVKTASNNRLTKEGKRRHSLSGTADIFRFMYDDQQLQKLTHRLSTVASSPNPGNIKNLSSDALATALAANNILESHV